MNNEAEIGKKLVQIKNIRFEAGKFKNKKLKYLWFIFLLKIYLQKIT